MLTRREERLLRSLRQRKARESEGLFLAEGVRAVEDLLASPLPVRLAVAASSLGDTPRGQALTDALFRKRVPLHDIADRELAELADTETPQGILAVAPIPRVGLDALRVEAHDPAVVLVLDAVQDPGNFGTLARTAEALGAVGLVALPGTVDPWNPKSVRAAMGSTFRLPVVEVGWDELAPWLAANDVTTLAAVVGGEPLGEPRPRRAALVLGNEGAGVGDETRARAHRGVGIPLRGRAESLNVAAAGAILLHELLR
ncbi:RNA methyltransferase [Longimicrobium sp.]|uniref:TrmH family RNA methyltransferase n=1 Tax=Longimicrobium sp. TaxID=2029185 RepID=UPI002E2FE038|nr:RNA methyltransferase [Longimicrobium sp.]HEX6038154.1 RNA methyltransferase [Longimicrobium sp.]